MCYFHCISAFSTHTFPMYGLSVWGTSNDGYLSKLALQQKKVVRAIIFSDFYAHTSSLFKSLNILKIKDIFNHKIGSLMWDIDHHSLPDSLASMITDKTRFIISTSVTKTKTNYTPHIVLIIDMDTIRSHTTDHCY